MKKLLICLLALATLAVLLAACAGKAPESETDEDGEDYATGDASLDNPRNQDAIGDKELLVVSFGTSFNDNRRLTIGAIESALERAFPDWSVRRAFTSQIIIDHVKSRDGEVIDNVTEALDRAVANGVKTLVVQPTHLMDGYEYHDLYDELVQYFDAFERVVIAPPLLTSDDAFSAVADAIVAATAQYDDGETAIVFMGHGTEADSNGVYEKMQSVLDAKGMKNHYIGTVEATPSVEDVLTAVRASDYKRVVLRPLMVVAGDHANNDMAGDDEDSWKNIFLAAGYEVECVIEGLGSVPAIQQLYVEHAQTAVDALVDTSAVAGASQRTAVRDVVDDGMTPVYAFELVDGVYNVAVDCSSSMFKITDCELTVGGDALTAKLFMSSDAYGYLFPGTAEEAAEADEADYITFDEGEHSFVLPVAALDMGVPCAAWSRNKELWYDRTLVFRADSLPMEAFADNFFTTAESLGLAGGEYTVEVALAGGSGKASVSSPAKLTVAGALGRAGGPAAAEIVWSSSNYDYMRLGDEIYLPTNTEGNSTFIIPVAYFDRPITVYADTTAMSRPYEIAYTLTFDSASITAVEP